MEVPEDWESVFVAFEWLRAKVVELAWECTDGSLFNRLEDEVGSIEARS